MTQQNKNCDDVEEIKLQQLENLTKSNLNKETTKEVIIKMKKEEPQSTFDALDPLNLQSIFMDGLQR